MERTTIGEWMRQRRSELGLGQGKLAAKANQLAGLTSGGLIRNEITRYERGLRTPHDWLPFLAQALGVSPHWLAGAPVPASLALADALTRFEQHVGLGLDRRTFLADSSGLALTVIPTGSPPSRAVPPECIGYFRNQLRELWAADASHSSHRLVPSALAHFRIVAHVASLSHGGTRKGLWEVAAGFAGLITWLYQDVGKLDQSTVWGIRTLHLAHRSHDRQLVAHALANRAMVAMDDGDGPTTIETASAALADESHLCAKVRVQALQQAAHGYALVGDRTSADRLLDRAGELIGHIDDDYAWGNATRTPFYLETQRATCYSRMRLGPEAVQLWDQIVPGARWQNSGAFAARRAAALADSRQPEESVEALATAIRVAVQVDSARLWQELQLTWERLVPWHGAPVTDEARALLAHSSLRINHRD